MTDKYLFSQGNISFENGDYTRAISFYSNAIDLNPDDLNYYSSRCISYLKNNEIEQAINDANILISKNPNIDASYILLGISFLAYNQVEKAEDAFVRARTINPQNTIANQYLEEIQQSRQNGFCPLQSYAGNLQPIMQRYQEDPSSINDFSGNSSILDTLNSYLDRFDRPSTIHYHNYNNTTKYQNNDFLFSSLTDAKAMFSKGNYKEAINISQQALNNCNSNTPSSIVSSLFQIVSSSYMKIKDMRNAIGYSEYFLQLAAEKRIEVPKSVKQNCEYIQILSHHFTDRINSESGVTNYRASKSDEPMPLFFQTEILKHIKNKRYEKAVELSNQATSLFPNDASILSISSKAKQKVDDLKGAIEDGKKALSINSSLSKVSLLVAKCYIKMNELHQAKKFVRMALVSDVQNNKAVELQRLVQDLIHQQKEQEKVSNIQPAKIQNEESEEQKGGKFEGGDRLITPSDKPNSNPHSHRMQMIDGRRKKGPLFTMKNRSNSANDAEIDNTKPNSQPPDRRNYAVKLTYCSDNEDAAAMKPSSQTASYPRIQFKLGDSRTTSAKSTDNRNNDIEIDYKDGYKANLNSSQNNVYPTSQPPPTRNYFSKNGLKPLAAYEEGKPKSQPIPKYNGHTNPYFDFRKTKTSSTLAGPNAGKSKNNGFNQQHHRFTAKVDKNSITQTSNFNSVNESFTLNDEDDQPRHHTPPRFSGGPFRQFQFGAVNSRPNNNINNNNNIYNNNNDNDNIINDNNDNDNIINDNYINNNDAGDNIDINSYNQPHSQPPPAGRRLGQRLNTQHNRTNNNHH